MTVFLTSSPFVENADRAILSNANGFVDRIREVLPPDCRLLYICSSPDRRDLNCQFGADIFKAFSEQGMFFSSYHVLDALNADDTWELVANSDFIVLAGGHVPTQNAFFQEIGLREALEDYSGVVMGISAGSMNAADVVYAQPEEPGESSPEFPRFLPGLGLTDIHVLPHYQKVKDYELDGLRLFEDITYADSCGNTFFAIPDGSYIVTDEDGQRLFGQAYRIRDGILEMLTLEGEELDLDEWKW